jgi:potassium-transporting ATPase KdpC subunit
MAPIVRSLRALVVFSVLTGLLYPLSITAGAQLVFPRQADGSLITTGGDVAGSELIGQKWEGRFWFYGRPSAVDYDAASSGATNLGPTSATLAQLFAERADAIVSLEKPYRGPIAIADIPVDLLTSSASGLDPHISAQAARFQAPRIAEVRGVPLARVEELVAEHTESKTLGVWGQERVNVLRLNLALEAASET